MKTRHFVLLIGGWGAAVYLGLLLIILLVNEPHREVEAIERGFAIYHPQTGEFTWREDAR